MSIYLIALPLLYSTNGFLAFLLRNFLKVLWSLHICLYLRLLFFCFWKVAKNQLQITLKKKLKQTFLKKFSEKCGAYKAANPFSRTIISHFFAYNCHSSCCRASSSWQSKALNSSPIVLLNFFNGFQSIANSLSDVQLFFFWIKKIFVIPNFWSHIRQPVNLSLYWQHSSTTYCSKQNFCCCLRIDWWL